MCRMLESSDNCMQGCIRTACSAVLMQPRMQPPLDKDSLVCWQAADSRFDVVQNPTPTEAANSGALSDVVVAAAAAAEEGKFSMLLHYMKASMP